MKYPTGSMMILIACNSDLKRFETNFFHCYQPFDIWFRYSNHANLHLYCDITMYYYITNYRTRDIDKILTTAIAKNTIIRLIKNWRIISTLILLMEKPGGK